MMVSGRGQLKSLRNEFISLVFPSSVFLSQTLKNMNKKRADIIKKIQKYVMPKEKKKKEKEYIKEDYKTQLHTRNNVIMTKKNQKSCTNMLKIFQYPSLFLCSLSAQSPS